MRVQINLRQRYLVLVSVLTILVVVGPSIGSASAINPYIGQHIEGYTSSVTGKKWDPVSQIFGYTNFGTSSPVYLNPDLLSILSSAGWNKASDTATGYNYQFPIQMKNDGLVYNDAQVWNLSTPIWYCFPSGCPSLSYYASIQYVYYTMYWNAARTQATFFAEAHLNGGGVSYNSLTYTKGAQSQDTSTDFSAGYVPRTYGGKNFYAKLLQTGAESDNPASNWQVNQYGIVYYPDHPGASSRSLSSDNTFSNIGGTSDTSYYDMGRGSDIAWNPSTGAPVWIGGETYSADALYYNLPGSGKAPGDVRWFSGTQLPYGKALWGKGSLHVLAANIYNNNNIDGLYVTVRNSGGGVIASGFTPLNIIISQSGTYYVDYTNYSTTYYFTNVYSTKPASVTDYNVYSWGGSVKLNLTDKESYTLTAKYLDQTNAGIYSRLTVNSSYLSGSSLTGMYTALLPAGASTPYTKGYTPYTVGIVSPNISYDVVWNNYVNPPNTPAYYQRADQSTGLHETFDNKYSWGGVQRISGTGTFATYTDTGRYNATP